MLIGSIFSEVSPDIQIPKEFADGSERAVRWKTLIIKFEKKKKKEKKKDWVGIIRKPTTRSDMDLSESDMLHFGSDA